MRVLLCIAFAVVVAIDAQIISGPCDGVKGVVPDLSKITGKWYPTYRTFNVAETIALCPSVNVTSKGSSITIDNKQFDLLALFGRDTVGSGNVTTDGKFKITYPGNPFPMTYTILATDNTEYASIFACSSAFITNLKYGWIWTRSKTPAKAIVDKAMTAFANTGISSKELTQVDQSWCFMN